MLTDYKEGNFTKVSIKYLNLINFNFFYADNNKNNVISIVIFEKNYAVLFFWETLTHFG